jgi:hypothetical protein
MPFVLPLTDQEAENARLLDRLTKQQEINQSLRVEIEATKDAVSSCKAEYDDDIGTLKTENAELKAQVEKLKAGELEWQQAFRPFGGCLTLFGPSALGEYLKVLNAENDKLKNDLRLCAEGLIPNDLIQRGIVETCREKVKQLELEIERLKAESIRSVEENRKTILEAKFDTWRELMGKYESDYNIEDEAEWLIGEATHISDAIEIFNDLYEEVRQTGDEYIWQLKCDHERKWEVYQVYMDDEGDYTLTEEEFEALKQEDNDPEEYGEYTWKQGLTPEEIAKGDTINPETGEALTCDFCDKERKVLTKRDAGYDEWTCSTCHKEQYPEQYEEKQ